MSPSSERRLGRLRGVAGFPSERDWDRAPLLTPQSAGPVPALVGDGSGLSFSPAEFAAPGGGLDEDDPAVQALVAMLGRQKPGADGLPPTSLAPWRLLARSGDDVLFGHGAPPRLLTVVMRRHNRHGWMSHVMTKQAT